MPCPPKMRGCPHTCQHFALVSDYRAERERQLSQAEETAGGYATELAELRAGLITFQAWLAGRAGRRAA